MAEETATTATTSETTSEGDGKNTTDKEAGAGTQTAKTTTEATTTEKTFTQAELEKIVKKRVAEEQKRAEKAAADAQLPEIERLKKQAEEHEKEKAQWTKERQERDAKDSIINLLSDEKAENPYRAKNPHTVYKLIKSDLEYGDDGKPLNHLQLLKALKAEDPNLFGSKSAGSVNGGDGGKANLPVTDMNALIRAGAGRG